MVYKPTPKAQQLGGGGGESHTGLEKQQFPKRKGRGKECWINTPTATTSDYTDKGPRHGKVCMTNRLCGNIMVRTSVSSLWK